MAPSQLCWKDRRVKSASGDACDKEALVSCPMLTSRMERVTPGLHGASVISCITTDKKTKVSKETPAEI